MASSLPLEADDVPNVTASVVSAATLEATSSGDRFHRLSKAIASPFAPVEFPTDSMLEPSQQARHNLR